MALDPPFNPDHDVEPLWRFRALLMKPLNMADLALNIRRVLDKTKGRK